MVQGPEETAPEMRLPGNAPARCCTHLGPPNSICHKGRVEGKRGPGGQHCRVGSVLSTAQRKPLFLMLRFHFWHFHLVIFINSFHLPAPYVHACCLFH